MLCTRRSRGEVCKYVLFALDIMDFKIKAFLFQHHFSMAFRHWRALHPLQQWIVVGEDVELHAEKQAAEVQNRLGETKRL